MNLGHWISKKLYATSAQEKIICHFRNRSSSNAPILFGEITECWKYSEDSLKKNLVTIVAICKSKICFFLKDFGFQPDFRNIKFEKKNQK